MDIQILLFRSDFHGYSYTRTDSVMSIAARLKALLLPVKLEVMVPLPVWLELVLLLPVLLEMELLLPVSTVAGDEDACGITDIFVPKVCSMPMSIGVNTWKLTVLISAVLFSGLSEVSLVGYHCSISSSLNASSYS